MTSIVLSIVIPTYQRAKCLQLLLMSLTQNLSNWPIDCEVIVLDNASKDNTNDVVSRFEDYFPIKYFCNEKNIGMDGNIASCFDVSSGKYLWVLGDDEILYSGTLEYVLNLCRTKEFGLLHMENGGFRNDEGHKVSEIAISRTPKITSLNSKDMFRQANIFLTFISANVINKKSIIEKFPDFNAKAEINTFLPQMAWIYSALKTMDNHFFVQSPMFGALTGNTGGYKFIEVFGVNLIRITKKYFSDGPLDAVGIMSNAVITRLIPGEIMHQLGKSSVKSKFEHEDINSSIKKCFGDKVYFKLFLMPLLSGSKISRQVAFLFVRIFNKFNKKMKYIML